MADGVRTRFAMDFSGATAENRQFLARITETEAALRKATDTASRLERRLEESGRAGSQGLQQMYNRVLSVVGGYISLSQAINVATTALQRNIALEKERAETSLAAQASQRKLLAFSTSPEDRQRFAAAATAVGIAPQRAATIQAAAYDAGLSTDEAVKALRIERTGFQPEAVIAALKKTRLAFGAEGDVRGQISQLLASGRYEDIFGAIPTSAGPAASLGGKVEEFLGVMKVLGESELKNPERAAKGINTLIETLAEPTIKVGEGKRARETQIQGVGILQRLGSLPPAAIAGLDQNARLVAEVLLRNPALVQKSISDIRGEATGKGTFRELENRFLGDQYFAGGERLAAEKARQEYERVFGGQTGREAQRTARQTLIETGAVPDVLGLGPGFQEFGVGVDDLNQAFFEGQNERLRRAGNRRRIQNERFGAPGAQPVDDGLGGLTELHSAARELHQAAREIRRATPVSPTLASPDGKGNR